MAAIEMREMDDYCVYKGKKYMINERIEDGCANICKCVSSSVPVECQPRCPKKNRTTVMHEQCVTVPDPKDGCCEIEFCDVTLDDHEQSTMATVPTSPLPLGTNNGSHTAIETTDNNRKHAFSTDTSIIDDTKEKYDCEHNGSKYKTGMQCTKKTVAIAKVCSVHHAAWLLFCIWPGLCHQ